MRRALLILPLLLAAALVWAVHSGMDARVAAWAAGWQREFQTGLAGALRALRAGEPGATALLLGLCFAYGFFHAVGPGHGKILIGGYGLGRQVPLLRLSVISVVSALGQAATAIALVLVGMLALGWTRQALTGAAEGIMLPASTLAIGLVGLWLAWRGLRGLWRLRPVAAPAGHDTGRAHDHPHDHDACGHDHGPTPEDLRHAGSLGESLALVGSIAIRPCSGAILLLVLTWHMGILAAGVLGTVAMSLGTAALTLGVAVVSVFARETTVLSFDNAAGARAVLPAIQLLAGVAVATISLQMLAGLL